MGYQYEKGYNVFLETLLGAIKGPLKLNFCLASFQVGLQRGYMSLSQMVTRLHFSLQPSAVNANRHA